MSTLGFSPGTQTIEDRRTLPTDDGDPEVVVVNLGDMLERAARRSDHIGAGSGRLEGT